MFRLLLCTQITMTHLEKYNTCGTGELTFLWNDLTIEWYDRTWNDLAMKRNERTSHE